MITRRSYTIDAKSLQSLRTITKWLITFRAFIQATSNKRDTLLEKWKKKLKHITTEQLTNRNESSFLTSVIVLPCSWTAFWHGGTGSSCPDKQDILVASNERECQCIWLVRLELCWTFLVLRFLLSSLALMKPFKRLTGSNGQPNRDPCGVERKRVSVFLTRQIWTVLNFSRSAISAFIPRTDETSSENHKTLSRFDFERLLILLGYLETDYCQQLHSRTGSHGLSEERNALPRGKQNWKGVCSLLGTTHRTAWLDKLDSWTVNRGLVEKVYSL